MTGIRRLIAVAIAVAWCAVLASEAACAEPQTAAGQPELCELQIEGHSILSLTLLRRCRPYPAIALEASRARGTFGPARAFGCPRADIVSTASSLKGATNPRTIIARDDEWFELAPGKPHQLVIGAPLSPQVTVTRHGKFLEMDCDLVDAAGRSYSC